MRLFFAILLGKMTRGLLRLFGRSATQAPGVVALKICPDVLQRMPKPAKIIAVTGTNGKTTVTNLIAEALTATGRKVISNSRGANIQTGVIAALLADVTLTGRSRSDVAVLECDERSSRLLYPALRPQLIVVTNLFRDSLRRNAHPEYIRDFITSAVPEDAVLVLNADDAIASAIAPQVKRVYYSFDKQDYEPQAWDNIVNDVRLCPSCHQPIVWDMRRYHHIGRFHCPHCGYQSPEADYRLTKVDRNLLTAVIECHGTAVNFPLCDGAVYNIYDSLTAAAALMEFGLTPQQAADSLQGVRVVASRLVHGAVAGRPLDAIMAKGFNSVAVSRSVQQVAEAPGRKAVFLLFDDLFCEKTSSENISWIYDVDYEQWAADDVVQVVAIGPRCADSKLRLMMAGIPAGRIMAVRTTQQALNVFEPQRCDRIYVLFDLYRQTDMERLVAQLQQRYGQEAAR